MGAPHLSAKLSYSLPRCNCGSLIGTHMRNKVGSEMVTSWESEGGGGQREDAAPSLRLLLCEKDLERRHASPSGRGRLRGSRFHISLVFMAGRGASLSVLGIAAHELPGTTRSPAVAGLPGLSDPAVYQV